MLRARAAGTAAPEDRERRDGDAAPTGVPGKRTLVDATAAMSAGVARSLPYLSQIQASFGRHDIGGVRAYVGGAAGEHADALGANGFAVGDQIAFAGEPDLFLAAHEAAHVVQQRRGVSGATDALERHADRIAALVVRRASAEALLDEIPDAGGGGGVLQMDHRERDRIERAQSWDVDADHVPDAAAAADTEAIARAIRAIVARNPLPAPLAHVRRALGIRANGSVDRDLVIAIRRHQAAGHRPVTGELDDDTVRALGTNPGRVFSATPPAGLTPIAGDRSTPADGAPSEAPDPAAERRRGELAGHHSILADILAQIPGRALRDAYWERKRQQIRTSVEALSTNGVSNPFATRAAQARTPSNAARYAHAALCLELGLPLPRGMEREAEIPRPAAEADEPRGTMPELDRQALAEAEAHLQEAGVAIHRTTIRNGEDGWDGRVMHRRANQTASVEEVRARAITIVGELRAHRGVLHAWAKSLEIGIDSPSILPSILPGFGPHIEVAILRQAPWRPRLATIGPVTESTPEAVLVGLARRALASVIRARNEADRHIQTHLGYQSNPLQENTNGVRVDLDRTGITSTNNHGNPLHQQDLDVLFADAVLRFMEDIRTLGVTGMRTSGFHRNPTAPGVSSHGRGQALDIVGFTIGDAEYVLHADPARSAWHDHTTRINERTVSQIFHAITARMARFFSLVVGPGHNADHDTHWHVELTSGSTDRIHAVQSHDHDHDHDH
jgi:hypothetical protein